MQPLSHYLHAFESDANTLEQSAKGLYGYTLGALSLYPVFQTMAAVDEGEGGITMNWTKVICALLGHDWDRRGDVLKKCRRCQQWHVDSKSMEFFKRRDSDDAYIDW